MILKEAHHAAQSKKQADRIKTILLLNQGLAYGEITRLLLLDDSTLRRYYREYEQAGIDGLLEDPLPGIGHTVDEKTTCPTGSIS